MAQQVKVSLFDDVDGSEADETVCFGLDGAVYEIDLSAGNAAKLRQLLAEFTSAGRIVNGRARIAGGGRKGGAKPARKPRTGDSERAQAIRAWAQAEGFAVSTRGRISAEVLRAYGRRQSGESAAEATGTTAKPATPARSVVSPPLFSGL